MRTEAMLSTALRIMDDAWEELREGSWVKKQLGLPLDRLPDLSYAEAERRTKLGQSLLARIEALDLDELPTDIALTVRLVRSRASTWAREAEWYWTVCDPSGIGFFGMFLPTAYCAGFVFNFVHGQLAAFPFTRAGDPDRYLALVADYAHLVEQIAERTEGQAARGIWMPKAQVTQARTLMSALRNGCRASLAVAPERLGRSVSTEAFQSELYVRIAERVEPAFDRVLAVLSDNYFTRAPEAVGLSQYPGGKAIYAELVKLHTTLDLTPEQVHARGLERIARIESDIRKIREEVGCADAEAFATRLQADQRYRAGTVEGVTAIFQRYIDRLKPRLSGCFHDEPNSPYTIAPLPETLQGSMTFGYYDAPRAERPIGTYFFNTANLTRQPLAYVGTLTYHELVPGHHLHFSTQQRITALHPFRAFSFFNAFNEGWAEYAATLAGEMGMYETPEERYGRLVMDAFLTCRLVVDTGMNALGWSLEKAREYLRAHSGMEEAEIRTETVRYSCDIPAQSLAYKLGDTEILAQRERMRSALGALFDIRDFHTAVLGAGALPLPELALLIKREIERLSARA
jgi:uncharacterized protein (DUF885 family)